MKYINFKNYNGICWWSGNIADSREHKYKKSDFVRHFGTPPYGSVSDPALVKDGKTKAINGPKADILKFKKNINAKYNNEISQPFDFSYSRFIEYFEENQKTVLKNQRIDFSTIFENPFVGKLNLIRYIVKHIGCRLSDNNIEVDRSLIDFLNGKDTLDHLCITFHISLDRYVFLKKTESPYLGLSPLDMVVNENNHSLIHHVYGNFSLGTLDFFYIYSKNINNSEYPGLHNYFKYPWIVLTPIYINQETLASLEPELKDIQKAEFDKDDYLSFFFNSKNYFSWYDSR
ncbi:hypothetical protein CH381_31370 [Leptospira sp. mixed culture ATI2-C-A1]|nr:hypothetical protein CH381_31370 [Leptospira sp. mixed culture ATI2-C-A1]